MSAGPIELASTVLTVGVSTQNLGKDLLTTIKGIGGKVGGVGRESGTAFREGFSSTAKGAAKTAESEVERLQKAVQTSAKALKAARDAERDATAKVAIEEAKLAELRDSGKAKTSQLLAAEDRIEKARRAQALATDKVDASVKTFTGHQKELATTTAAASAGADKAGAAYQTLGQRLKGALTGIKNPFSRMPVDAATAGTQSSRAFGQRFSAGMPGAMSGIGGMIKSGLLAGVAAVGVTSLTGMFGEMITGAGKLEQSVGAIDAVFKSSSSQMHGWAKSAATDVGLTQNEFNELGTLIGAQLKNGGTAMADLAPKTKQLIGVGADLSSMFGGTTREAVEALSSALKGERDPIERYGVTLNQAKIDAEAAALGFKKVGGSFSGQAQQAATLSLIMKQTADAQGNFGRESDTFAHKQQVAAAQWDELKTKIGSMFLPAITVAMGFLTNTALPALDGLATNLSLVGQFLAPVGAAFTAVGAALSPLAPVLQPIAVGIAAGAAAFGLYVGITTGIPAILTAVRVAMLAVNATMLANPIGIVVALLAALVGAFIYAYNTSIEFRNVVDGALKWVQQTALAVGSWFAGPFVGFFVQAGAWLGAQFDGIRQWFDRTVQGLMAAGYQVGSFFMDTVPGFFASAASAIGAAFGAVKDFILAPIRGALSGINGVLSAVGAPQIPMFAAGGEVPAMARGGILSGFRSYRRGDDRLVAMRSGEGVYVSEAMRDPYERQRLAEVNAAALAGRSLAPFQIAPVDGMSSGGMVAGPGFRDVLTALVMVASGTIPTTPPVRPAVTVAGAGGPQLITASAAPSASVTTNIAGDMRVTINNPTGQPSERSITQALTKSAYLGVGED